MDIRGLLDLTDDDKKGALNMGLLQAGLATLAANTSRNPMPAIGQGGLQGIQGYQQAMDRAQKQKLLEIQKEKYLRELKQQQAMDAFQQKVAGGAYTTSPAQQALSAGGGPTPASAAAMPQFKPKFDRGALYQDMLGVPGLMPAGLQGQAQMEENALKREETRALLDAKIVEARLARDQKSVDALERLKLQLDSKKDIAELMASSKRDMAGLAASMRQPPAPIVTTDAAGNAKMWSREGNLIKDLGATGKPSATFEKTAVAKKKLGQDVNTAITELEKATADGGLIDRSTGSGAGALVDIGAGFFGKATPGSIAVGQVKPIFDLVLKMVPRFEGPQSDKDTQSYKEAAGELANPAVPNSRKKAAGKEILRLMKARRGQFVDQAVVGTEADSGGGWEVVK